MKTPRKLFAGLCVAAACLVAALTPANAKPLKIGAAVYGLRGEYMKMWVNQLQQHPAVKSGDVRIVVFDGRYDPNVQNDQFDTMIVQQFDGILFVPIDKEAGSRSVERAMAEGIPVVGSNTRVSTDKIVAYVGNDDVKAGEMEAQSVVDRLGGKGNVVIIEGPIGQSSQIERRQGNLNVLKNYPDIKVLDMKPGNWDRALAMSLMENWLTAHPGKIDGVIAQNDDMALGAIQAIRAAGLNVNDFAVVGVDGIQDAFAAAKAGDMISVLQDAKAQSQGALDVLLRHIKGKKYEPQSDIWEFYSEGLDWNGGTDKNYDIPWTLISKENSDALREQISK